MKKTVKKIDCSWPDMLTDEISEADIIIKGVPFDNAVSNGKGACFAPDIIRKKSEFFHAISEDKTDLRKLRVYDAGDFEMDLDWQRYFNNIEIGMKEIFDMKKFCITLGGDHSVTIPVIKAFSKSATADKGKVGYIQFDSHPDLMSEFMGSSLSHACTARRAVEDTDNINTEDITFIGIRSYLYEEVDYLSKHPEINIISAEDVFDLGVDKVNEKLQKIYEGYNTIYVSLDIDVLDPAYAPGTGTPEFGGLRSMELQKILKFLIEQMPVKSMDIVEVSPPLDSSELTAYAAVKLIYSVFGRIAAQKE